MNKREKIFIVLTVLVSLYALIDMVVLPGLGSEDKGGNLAQEEKAARDMATVYSADTAKIERVYRDKALGRTLALAEADWSKDPFRARGSLGDSGPKKDLEDEVIAPVHYSGYVRAGKHIYAIINGLEYSVGDLVDTLDYKVIRILDASVFLQLPSGREIMFPLKEN